MFTAKRGAEHGAAIGDVAVKDHAWVCDLAFLVLRIDVVHERVDGLCGTIAEGVTEFSNFEAFTARPALLLKFMNFKCCCRVMAFHGPPGAKS